MPNPSRPPLALWLARWRRPLGWGLGALLVLEVLYNIVLVTGLLAAVLNHFTQDRPRVEWSRAWSLVPGRVHVRGLKLFQEDIDGSFWELQMDEVKVNLSLVSLLRRQLKTESLDVQGLRVRLHAGVAVPGVESPEGPPLADPWKLLLHGVRVQEVNQLDWDGFLLTGISEAVGSLELVPQQRVSVRGARLILGQGQFSHEKEVLAHVEQGLAEFSLEAQRRDDPVGGLDLIAGLTDGRLQFSATHPALEDMPELTSVLEGISLKLKGGAGRVEADLHVKNGHLGPGTQLKGSAEPLHASMGPLRMRAPWSFHSDVYTPEDGVDRLGLQLTLGPVKLEGRGWPSVESPEVNVFLAAKAPRLDQALRDAHVEVHTGKLQATWDGTTMTGQAYVDIDAHQMAVQQGKLVLHGSQVRFQDVSVQTGQDEEHGWSGTLTFPEATLTLSPPSFEGRFTGSFSSAAPIVALLTVKGALPRPLAPLLAADNLELTGVVSLGKGGAKVSRLHAKAEGLELHGQAESSDGAAPHAVFLVKMGILSVGVEAGAEGTHLQVLHPSSWYQEKTGEPTD